MEHRQCNLFKIGQNVWIRNVKTLKHLFVLIRWMTVNSVQNRLLSKAGNFSTPFIFGIADYSLNLYLKSKTQRSCYINSNSHFFCFFRPIVTGIDFQNSTELTRVLTRVNNIGKFQDAMVKKSPQMTGLDSSEFRF